MKIRLGFVSNSSSSSFILKFDKDIEKQDDLKTVLFGNMEGGIRSNLYKNTMYDFDQIYYHVVNKIIKYDEKKKHYITKKASKKDMIELISNDSHMEAINEICGSFSEYLRLNKENILKEKEKEIVEKCREIAEKRYKKFTKDDTPETIHTIVEFSDNDGDLERTIEHGNIFKNIKHIIISHH